MKSWRKWLCCLLPLLCVFYASCRHAAPEADATLPPWFHDDSDAVGLDFVHDPGPITDDWFMPQIIGSGAALFDFDNDGLLDVYLLQSAGPQSTATNRLYRQLPGGRFQDVSKGSGLDIVGWNVGAAVGDVNNDGWPDVVVTQYRGVKLFVNNRDGTFADLTQSAGLSNPHWGTSACFFDYDRDGWLDLVIVNYVEYDPKRSCPGPDGQRDFCSPRPFQRAVSKLFHNRGASSSAVRFEDVTQASGLARRPGPGLGVLCADFDGDGWPDILIANDGEPNHLWINQTDGTFKEEAHIRGLACNALGQSEANMGIGWGDIDGDGLQDVLVTHLATEVNTLWRQGPRGAYRDATTFTHLHHPNWKATGFGVSLGDFNHDGALDAAIVNGAVLRASMEPVAALSAFWSRYAERNQLFSNDGSGGFLDVSPYNPDLCRQPNVGRGLAVADVTGDGALDLLVTSVAGRARLYRNVAPDRGHWLMVRALDPALKRDAVGAEIVVRAGPHRWIRTLQSGGSFLCAGDCRAHFGLGDVERFDAIHVRWPDDVREVFDGAAKGFEDGRVNRIAVLKKGDGRTVGKN